MSNTQGVQFGMEGPVMTGTWFNPQNGHKFTVRDCFFQDGQFVVQTMDGQILDYNTIQNYVQVGDKDGRPAQPDSSMLNGNKPSHHTMSELPPEVAEMLLPEDNVQLGGKGLGNIYDSVPTNALTEPVLSTRTTQSEDVDFAMIKRVLGDRPAPVIDATMSWDCPDQLIESLVKVLGVDPKKIAEYYIQQMDRETMFEQIKSKFAEWIGLNLAAHEEPEEFTVAHMPPAEINSDQPTPKKPKKTKKSK